MRQPTLQRVQDSPAFRAAVRALAVLVCGLGLTGAAGSERITPSLEPSRTSGAAPLAVFFDATGTKCQGCGEPFHDLHYAWSFGDAKDVWRTSGRPKHVAYGPTAAHVFEQPGTYTVTLQVSGQNGGPQTRRVSIHVEEPGKVWPGEKTLCVSASGRFSDCPAGARRVTTDSLDEAQKECGAHTRCLFRRGEVFSGSLRLGTAGPGLVGPFGTGALPRLRGDPKRPLFAISGGSDWRIVDLELEGARTKESLIVNSTKRTRNILLLRTLSVPNTFHAGLVFPGNNLDLVDQDLHDGLFAVENDWRQFGRGSGGNIAFVAARRIAFLGNTLEDTRRGEHVIRVQHGEKGVISSNVFADQANTKGLLTIRSRDQADDCSGGCGRPSRHWVVSDNTFRGRDDINLSITGTNKKGEQAYGVDFIVERNFFSKGSDDAGLQMAAKFEDTQGITLRNNVVVMNRWQTYRGFEFSGDVGRVKVYHNTCYVPDRVSVPVRCVRFLGTAHAEAFNNVLYAPNAKNPVPLEGRSEASGGNLAPSSNPFVVASPSRADDFVLRKGTPPIAAGVRILNPLDFRGEPRATGSSPDVGAFTSGAAGEGAATPPAVDARPRRPRR